MSAWERTAHGQSDGDSFFVSEATLLETTWVLKSIYGLERRELHATIKKLLSSAQVVVENADLVQAALERAGRGKATLPDHLIVEHATQAGCAWIWTVGAALLKARNAVCRAP